MRVQPPPITVDPPPVTVDPPIITKTPPSFTVTPPSVTVTPPSVIVLGRSYTPPAMTVSPPAMSVTPPPIRVDPPSRTVNPPGFSFQPDPIEVEVPAGQEFVFVDPPPIQVNPPALTVDLPSITVHPPQMTVTPGSFTISGGTFRVDPPGPAPARDIAFPDFTVQPPAFLVSPPPVTVDVPSITVNPPPIRVDPPPVVVNLGSFTWGRPRFTTVVQNGEPANRLDVVIIGDGYTATQQGDFRDDVDRVVNAFRLTEPMSTYFRHFNFHRVVVVSPQDGTDDMFARPPRRRRTALHTFYSPIASRDEIAGGGGRRLLGPDLWVKEVVAQSGAPCDEIIVLVNSPRRGGATAPTMEVAYASRNSVDFPDIVLHEAGHSIANLMDEYDNVFPDINWPEDWVLPRVLPWVNVDTDPMHPKWRIWLSAGAQLPTPDTAPDETVGAFKGAAYTPDGVYRPEEHCWMRDPTYPPFCVVCAEAWIASIYRRSRLADSFSPQPNPTVVNRQVSFGARAVRPEFTRTTWFTKHRSQPVWQLQRQTESYQDFTTAFSIPGQWEVKIRLEDGSDRIRTPEVRDLARLENVWVVIVR